MSRPLAREALCSQLFVPWQEIFITPALLYPYVSALILVRSTKPKASWIELQSDCIRPPISYLEWQYSLLLNRREILRIEELIIEIRMSQPYPHTCLAELEYA